MVAMQNWSKLAVRLPEALHRAAKAKAAEEAVNLEDIIADFLRSWVEPERVARIESLLAGKANGNGNGREMQEAKVSKRKGGKEI